MKLLAFLFCFFLSSSALAEDFDFGSDEKTSSGFKLPIRGNIAAELARQIENAPRWQRLGVASHLTLDWQSPIGQFIADGNIRYNPSHRIENDPNSIISRFEIERILRETYWTQNFGNLTLSIGKKIIVWGKADALVITDVISPRDQTAFFFARPDETRLGQNVVAFDYYQPKYQLSLIFIPIADANRITPNGHPYSSTPGIDLVDKVSDPKLEIGMRYQRYFDGGEFSVLGGYFSNRDPIVQVADGFEQLYLRSPMLGVTFNYALDPFLLKFEAAYQNRLPMQVFSGTAFAGAERIDTGQFMIGADFQAAGVGTFIFEGSIRTPAQELSTVPQSTKLPSIALGWSEEFLNDDLSISLFQFFFRNFRNAVTRLGGDYKIHDDWKLTGQWTFITSDPTDLLFGGFRGFDRIDLGLEYHFDLSR